MNPSLMSEILFVFFFFHEKTVRGEKNMGVWQKMANKNKKEMRES